MSVTGLPPLFPGQQCPETLPHTSLALSVGDSREGLDWRALSDSESVPLSRADSWEFPGMRIPVVCRALLWLPETLCVSSCGLSRSRERTALAGEAPSASGPVPWLAAAFLVVSGELASAAARILLKSGSAVAIFPGDVLCSRVTLGNTGCLGSSGRLTCSVSTEVLLGSG